MSVMSSLRRSVYGVPPDPQVSERPYQKRWRKRRFWAAERNKRTAIHQRAAAILRRELDRIARRHQSA